MASYIGNSPVPQATQTRDRFVATAGQTSFPTSGYTAGYLDVFLNGVKLDTTDFTAINGSDVVLAIGAAADDIVEVVAYSTFEVLNQTFSGDTAVTGDFTVDGNVGVGTTSLSAKFTFDNSYDATPSDVSKIHLYNNAGDIYGLGVSGNNLNYRAGSGDTYHSFYSGTQKTAALYGNGTTDATFQVYGSQGSVLLGGNANHGYMEIGGPSGALIDMKSPYSDDFDTRIEVDANSNFSCYSLGQSSIFSNGYSFLRSQQGIDIVANHGTGTNYNIVLEANNGQIYLNSWLTGDRMYLNGIGSGGHSGNVIVTNGSTYYMNRHNGYFEVGTDNGAKGITYWDSDARLKENVVDCTVSALPVFDAIEYKEFDWTEDAGRDAKHVKLGFIAQQLQEIEPDLVIEMSDGHLSVNNTEIVSYLMKAVSELSAEVKALKEKVNV